MMDPREEVSAVLDKLRLLVADLRDVEAARLIADYMADMVQAEALVPIALEIARMSPQPAARVIAGQALARLRPDQATTWRQVAETARGASDYRAATDAMEAAARTPQGQPRDFLLAALSAYQDNDLERAESLYVSAGEDDASACGLAVIAIARGATEAAATILRRVLARSPESVEALRLMAMVAPDLQTVEALTRVARDEWRDDAVRSAAAFALAQASDRAGDDITAAAWADLANSLAPMRAQPYQAAAQEQRAEALLALFDRLPPPGPPLLDRPRPIVIVGMPRSGTSIIESLLAAHPDVLAGGERTDLYLACREIEIVLHRHGPDAAARLFAKRRASLVAELGERLTRAGVISEVYLDKLPLNAPYAGLIARLLPEARIVFMRRDPVETALSIWLHDFSAAYPYASDLAHLAHAVGLNDRLRDAWAARLGDQFLAFDHDALCDDPEVEARRLYAFCGLDWNAAYLDPEKRGSATNTFSALQVREPIRAPKARAGRYPPQVAVFVEALKRA